MLYLLAAVGALTIAVLMWRAFGPSTTTRRTPRGAGLAPDDDPEFLRELDRRRHRDEDSA